MIMGLGGHWVYKLWGRDDVCICNPRRNIPFIEGSDSAVAYTKTALYLAKRINCDRLMLSYAKKKGRSINSKNGRQPRGSDFRQVRFQALFRRSAIPQTF